MKYWFYDDYSEGAHPEILKAIADANGDQESGYGNDKWSALGAERIAAQINADVDVHFVPGGTHCNQIAMTAMLLPYQGVISPETGHMNVHESGAVESTGHKIITFPTPDGKLTKEIFELALNNFEDEHSVMPKVAYLTQPTELGTVYTKEEFTSACEFAKSRDLLIYVDGARLAMALASPSVGMTLADFAAAGVDVMYLGGTKVGGLFGEAFVILNDNFKPYFRHYLKRQGALLAKGRSMGAQFARFFDSDNLWLQLGDQSNQNAALLADGLKSIGVELAYEQVINQIFPLLPKDSLEKLKSDYGFYKWGPTGDLQMIRLTCSWATPKDAIEEFVKDVSALL